MKKILLSITFSLLAVFVFAQCTPNSLYQDSSYNIWPDTVINLPQATQSIPYSAVLDIKTPSTLLEATGGDSSLLYVTAPVIGTIFVGDWVIDQMELVSISGVPSGLSFGCYEPNCVLPGDILTCAWVDGTVDDTVADGVYPIEILVNVYASGDVFGVPYSIDLYSELGYYEEIPGYKIIVGPPSSTKNIQISEYSLRQNIPNPSNGQTSIEFITPISQTLGFSVVDILGKQIYNKEINSQFGVNQINLNQELDNGVYFYSIYNENIRLTKRMVVTN
jgi:hypothetical protein